MTDIVERLRAVWDLRPEDLEEAAAVIERLRAALQPFADLAEKIERCAERMPPPYNDPANWSKNATWPNLVAARAALEVKE